MGLSIIDHPFGNTPIQETPTVFCSLGCMASYMPRILGGISYQARPYPGGWFSTPLKNMNQLERQDMEHSN